MTWIQRAARNLLPLSREKSDFYQAKAEWNYTGYPYDLDEAIGTCELCGQQGLKLHFPIINRITEKQLQVGSECIHQFDIRAIGPDGQELSEEETADIVRADRNKLIKDAHLRRMINTLIKLAAKDEDFQGRINSIIEQYKKKKALSPKQLAMVVWRLNNQKMEFHPSDFKMSMKKPNEKTDFFALEPFKIEAMQKCLSTSQKQAYINHWREKTGRAEFKKQLAPYWPPPKKAL